MLTVDIYYIVTVWFLFITVTSGKKQPAAAILFLASLINIVTVDFLGLVDSMTYLESKEMLIKHDGVLALIMTMIMAVDKTAWKHALILVFAVLCHSMISLHLITDSSFLESVSFLFYEYYDELIILSALLQFWVSRDGMAKGIDNASRTLQSCLLRANWRRVCRIQGYNLHFKHKKSEKRT